MPTDLSAYESEHRPKILDRVRVVYEDGKRYVLWPEGNEHKKIPRSVVPYVKKHEPQLWAEWTKVFVALSNYLKTVSR